MVMRFLAGLSRYRAALMLSPVLLLASCGGGGDDEAGNGSVDSDAAASSALGNQIMVDPDLASQNQANSAVVAKYPNGELPPEMKSPEAIGRAQAQAVNLLGGPGKLQKAPKATELSGTPPKDSAYATAAQIAARPGNQDCTTKVDYTAQWAAKLPAAFPVYPQGAVQEAAGTDDGGCSLRVVSFLTPVAAGDVVDFYYTRAASAGYKLQHLKDGDSDVLAGAKDGSAVTVYLRQTGSGTTQVDLVTTGA
jgi:hypothetical protein